MSNDYCCFPVNRLWGAMTVVPIKERDRFNQCFQGDLPMDDTCPGQSRSPFAFHQRIAGYGCLFQVVVRIPILWVFRRPVSVRAREGWVISGVR